MCLTSAGEVGIDAITCLPCSAMCVKSIEDDAPWPVRGGTSTFRALAVALIIALTACCVALSGGILYHMNKVEMIEGHAHCNIQHDLEKMERADNQALHALYM